MFLDGRQLVFCELTDVAVMLGDLLPEVRDIMPVIDNHVAHEFTIELVATQSRKAILLFDRLRYRFFRQRHSALVHERGNIVLGLAVIIEKSTAKFADR